MTNYAMLDLETLGVIPTSIVLSVGIAIFNEKYEIIDKKMWILDKNEQLKLKRTYNQGTVDFWKRQPKEAKEQFNSDEVYNLEDFKINFYNYVSSFKIDTVWSSAPVLDVGCLQTLFGDGDYLPWRYDQVRCLRTIRDYMQGFPDRGENIHHDCLYDCIYQIECLAKSVRDMLFYGYNTIKEMKNE